MAKRRGFFRKARRAGRRLFAKARKAHRSVGEGSLLTKTAYSTGYGFARPFATQYADMAANAVPFVNTLPNGMGRELVLGTAGFLVHKFVSKPIGATILVNEGFMLGQKLNQTTLGSGAGSPSMYL